MVRKLLAAGAQGNVKDKEGHTAEQVRFFFVSLLKILCFFYPAWWKGSCVRAGMRDHVSANHTR